MSGLYDQFVQDAGEVDSALLTDVYKIRVCKDRTLSITQGREKPFNGVAIAVYSVPTRDEAVDLVMALGSLQYTPHPSPESTQQMPCGQWRKITPDDEPFAAELEYRHLSGLQAKIGRVATMIRARRHTPEAAA